MKSQAWSFYGAFQARIQTKVKEGVLSDETQLRSNEGLMGVWGSSPRKCLKMGTEKPALVVLVRPSRIFTYLQ